MSLPLVRQPEPRHTGAVFCDEVRSLSAATLTLDWAGQS